MGFFESALRANNGNALFLLKLFSHERMLALRAGFSYRLGPGCKFAIRVLTASIKSSALFGSSGRDFSLTTFLGAGNSKADRFGEFAFRIIRAGDKLPKSAHFHD